MKKKTYSGMIDDMLYGKIGINKELADTERVRSVATDEEHMAIISGLRDEMDQYLFERITYAFQVTSNIYPAN